MGTDRGARSHFEQLKETIGPEKPKPPKRKASKKTPVKRKKK